MKKVYPAYYPYFRCVAERCRHTCCQGWEIDIDAAALRRYRRMTGPMGERLRASIAEDAGGAHFILDSRERCPMLNAQGLCDLIIAEGERALCQICADHPRFRLRLRDREEIGLGLCCEAACRLILDWPEPFRLCVEDDGRSHTLPVAQEKACLQERQHMLDTLQTEGLPAHAAIDWMLNKYYGRPLPHTHRYWARYLLRLEYMEPSWAERLRRLSEQKEPGFRLDGPQLRNLCAYFIYRYAVSGWKSQKYPYNGHIAFIALSIRMIAWLCENPEDIYEIARQYSAEIEYSDINAEQLMTKLDRYAEERQ